MGHEPQAISTRLGFRDGSGSVHLERTMMLEDLRRVLDHVGKGPVVVDAIRAAIVDHNILGRTTVAARRRAALRLPDLYGLDDQFALFRAMRALAARDPEALPPLALLLAIARDSVLRDAMVCVRSVALGERFDVTEVATWLRARQGNRLSEASQRSVAQNLASSWAQAGLLRGVVKKTRVRLAPSAAGVAFAMFLGWLQGARGLGLFETRWTAVFDATNTELRACALDAGVRGMIRIAALGEVLDVSFPGWLTAEEGRMFDEQTRSAA